MNGPFTVSWSTVPSHCVLNLLTACGYNTYSLPRMVPNITIQDNINIELEKYCASKFTNDPMTEPVWNWEKVDFLTEADYTLFLLKWSYV